ncbi:MAG: hypothetical protein ABIA47_01055, partial [bacterium]
KGMKGADYRALWIAPSVIEQVCELKELYRGRFDHLLLVDATLGNSALVSCGNVYKYVDPDECRDIVGSPKDKDGKPLKRYIAFFQDGTRHLSADHTVAWWMGNHADDEYGLVTCEGLHLPVEHEKVLRHHGVDLPGSRYDEVHAPFASWFDGSQPSLNASHVEIRNSHYGVVSRGSVVVPVT